MTKHEYLKVSADIDNLEQVPSLIYDTLKEWWNTSYLYDLNPDEMIPEIVEQWKTKHIDTNSMKEAIQKIKDANVPDGIKIKLVMELLTSDGFLKLEDDIDDVLLFRPYITSKANKFKKLPYEHEHHDYRTFIKEEPISYELSLDTYIYDPIEHKFESLEIIDQETLIDEGVSSELINHFYSFHQRLMETTSKKIKVWTAQPEKRINEWNKQGFIPKNSYLTDDVRRAEYYFNPEEHDIIVFYRVPENQLIMTSDVFGAKEYITLNDVKIE